MAALAKAKQAQKTHPGPQPTLLPRDLYQLAELVELCFRGKLDAAGRSAVREMKAIGRLGPLLWPVALLDRPLRLGIGLGYVWRVDRRVVGNVSLYPGGVHPSLGAVGWLLM